MNNNLTGLLSNRPVRAVLRCGVLRLVPLAAMLLLSGCASLDALLGHRPEGMLAQPLFTSPGLNEQAPGADASAIQRTQRRTLVSDAPQVPPAASQTTIKPAAAAAQEEKADITLAFDQLPLPNFIQVVFGQVLKKNFSLDPALLLRTDLVTLRTGVPQTPTQVLETARLLLKSYGVAVMDLGGFIRIVPDSNQSGYLPEIRRGRAQPDVPLPMRPVFNLVELTAVKHGDVANWLKAMFGPKLTVQEDAPRNALLLSGQAAEVTAALEAIQVLDQPLMRGRSSRLITPASLGVDELAKRLAEILLAEGYGVGVGPAAGLPISLVPVPASNALLVFAADPAVLAHVIAWSDKLDSLDNDNRRGGSYFSYEVKYADAQGLAKTLQELMSGQERPQAAPAGVGMVIGAPRQPGRIVVNAATNTLIVNTSNPDEYAQLLSLMKALDKPSKSALIEVTVAEVRVGDKSQLGIEWNFGPTAAGSGSLSGGTSGGLSLGTGGLSLSYLNNAGVVRAKLNALASDNKARILSTPRVMARNGEAATIQVGQEVPIITSQQSTAATTPIAGNTAPGILQTIQYRSTGVILKVKPVIFAGRVELDVQQEVSSAASTSTGVNVSPTFSTRKIDTKLSIRDGATVALGGLISRTESNGQAGVPLLKDIPGLGQLFRTNTHDNDQTELIILITSYVVDNDLVAEQVTQAMRGQLGAWAQPAQGGFVPRPLVRPAAAQPIPEASAQSAAPLPREAASAPPAQTAIDRSAAAQAAPAPAASLVPTGRTVTDPVLLEEIRRAAEQAAKPAKSLPAKKSKTDKTEP